MFTLDRSNLESPFFEDEGSHDKAPGPPRQGHPSRTAKPQGFLNRIFALECSSLCSQRTSNRNTSIRTFCLEQKRPCDGTLKSMINLLLEGRYGYSATTTITVTDTNGDEFPLAGFSAVVSWQNGEPGGSENALSITLSQAAIGAAGVGVLTITGTILRRASATITLTNGTLSEQIAVFRCSPSPNNNFFNTGTAALGRTLLGAVAHTGALRPTVNPITLFESGHGFSLYTSGGASPFSNLNDTSSSVYGLQHAWAGTAGGASAGFAGVQRIGATAIDMRNSTLRMTYSLKNKANVQELGIFLGTSSLANYCRIYAHSNQFQWQQREGEIVTRDFPLGVRSFAAAADYNVTGTLTDLSAITDIRVRVQDGAAGPSMGSCEIHLYELSLVRTQANGYVLIMFDDGDASVWTEAFPRMSARNMVGHNFVIASAIGTSGKLTLKQLDALHAFNWDNCHHAYSDAVHDERVTMQSEAYVEADILAGKAWLNSRGYRGANYYAYPGGDFDSGTVSRLHLARKYFKVARGINTRQSETQPMSDPHKMRPIYVTSSTSVQLVKDRLDCAMQDSKGIAALVFHRLVSGAPSINTEYTNTDFAAILDHIVSNNYTVTTLSRLEKLGVI